MRRQRSSIMHGATSSWYRFPSSSLPNWQYERMPVQRASFVFCKRLFFAAVPGKCSPEGPAADRDATCNEKTSLRVARLIDGRASRARYPTNRQSYRIPRRAKIREVPYSRFGGRPGSAVLYHCQGESPQQLHVNKGANDKWQFSPLLAFPSTEHIGREEESIAQSFSNVLRSKYQDG